MKTRHPEIEQVLLCGSLARGEAVPDSDTDLLVILSSADRLFIERIPRYFPTGLPQGHPFIGQAVKERILLA